MSSPNEINLLLLVVVMTNEGGRTFFSTHLQLKQETMADLETANDQVVDATAGDEPTAGAVNDYAAATTTNEDDVDGEEEVQEINTDDSVLERIGTTSSARFNILSTMVGGGSLSLPLAFYKSGNALMGPILLLGTAVVTEFCFRVLVRSSRTLHPVHGATRAPGVDSFESIAAVAFGPNALIFTKILVVLMCFFGTV